jgi:hypothetical protein
MNALQELASLFAIGIGIGLILAPFIIVISLLCGHFLCGKEKTNSTGPR